MQGAENEYQISPEGPLEKVDSHFFQHADTFFQQNHSIGLTFDDVTLATDFSNASLQEHDSGYIPFRAGSIESAHFIFGYGYCYRGKHGYCHGS